MSYLTKHIATTGDDALASLRQLLTAAQEADDLLDATRAHLKVSQDALYEAALADTTTERRQEILDTLIRYYMENVVL